MKRTWELAFSESAYFEQLQRVIDILRLWDYECDTTSNADGDADYIFEVYDEDGDCMWADGDGLGSLRDQLPSSLVKELDRIFAKGKPQVIVGDAVKMPFPRDPHVQS